MKKRLTYFDLAKGIGIILVVLGHMENISVELRTWISSFHMPLFFMISGMLLAYKESIKTESDDTEKLINNSISSITKKNAKGLLIPYLWFSLIYIPIDIMNLFINNVDNHTFIQNILDSVTLSGVSVMWFLPALFIAEFVAIVLIDAADKIDKKRIVKYIVLFVLALIISLLTYGIWAKIRPVYDEKAGAFVYATLLGFIRMILRGMCLSVHVVTGFIAYRVIAYMESCYIAKRVDKSKDADKELIEKYVNNEIRGYCIALSVILFALNMGFCLKNGAVDNHFLILNNLILYYICAFIGSMAVILLSKGLDSIGFIEFLGKNSLIIMATHLQCYILYAGILVAIAIDAYVTRAKSYVYMFNSVLFTMLFELIVIFAINRFFPFVIGKKGKRNKE